jgi:hypothetical protein
LVPKPFRYSFLSSDPRNLFYSESTTSSSSTILGRIIDDDSHPNDDAKDEDTAVISETFKRPANKSMLDAIKFGDPVPQAYGGTYIRRREKVRYKAVIDTLQAILNIRPIINKRALETVTLLLGMILISHVNENKAINCCFIQRIPTQSKNKFPS